MTHGKYNSTFPITKEVFLCNLYIDMDMSVLNVSSLFQLCM